MNKNTSNKRTNESSKIFGQIVLSTILFMLLVVIIFIIFNGIYPTSLPTDWGGFGDYLSGTLGTFLAVLNVIVLYYLAKTAKELEKKLLEAQIKHSSYVELTKTLNHYIFNISEHYQADSFELVAKEARKLYYFTDSIPIEMKYLLKIDSGKIFENFLKDIKEIIDHPNKNETIIKGISSKAKFVESFQNLLEIGIK